MNRIQGFEKWSFKDKGMKLEKMQYHKQIETYLK